MTPHWHVDAAAPKDWLPCEVGALFSRYSAGDARARETIIVRFLPLARRLARLYEGRGEPIEDLRQAAVVGLIRAVDRYSRDRGEAFPAYARPMILGEIRRHFRDTTWPLHVPRPTRDRAVRVLRADTELRTTAESHVRPEAVARHLGIEVAEVNEARRALEAYWPASLDAPCPGSDGDHVARGEAIGADESGYERVDVFVGIERVLFELQPRDREILLLRLAGDLTQDEIAGRVGISQMHVSRILRKIRSALTTSCGLTVSGATV
jgi:RNA polymerase sigma-B factor